MYPNKPKKLLGCDDATSARSDYNRPERVSAAVFPSCLVTAQVLLVGAILCQGPRTVTATLRSDQAIARAAPVLLGLYSLVCVMAHRLTTDGQILLRSTAWYGKDQATFYDVLVFVRRAI